MKTKRQKISFSEINKDKIEIIDPKLISESKKRIKKEMKKAVRENIKKLALSEMEAKKLIINS